jgi:hypothetical protein
MRRGRGGPETRRRRDRGEIEARSRRDRRRGRGQGRGGVEEMTALVRYQMPTVLLCVASSLTLVWRRRHSARRHSERGRVEIEARSRRDRSRGWRGGVGEWLRPHSAKPTIPLHRCCPGCGDGPTPLGVLLGAACRVGEVGVPVHGAGHGRSVARRTLTLLSAHCSSPTGCCRPLIVHSSCSVENRVACRPRS